MLTPRVVASLFSLGMVILGASVAYGQDFPGKPSEASAAAIKADKALKAELIKDAGIKVQ